MPFRPIYFYIFVFIVNFIFSSLACFLLCIMSNTKKEKKMITITNYGSTLGETILNFMDRSPGVIPSILTVLIVGGFLLMG